ncbi:MAG: hypothetical protein SGI84_02645 [Gemmatimonadota bacterium]|nr:hypothetical protein [Gemmatimonadota bacterium]
MRRSKLVILPLLGLLIVPSSVLNAQGRRGLVELPPEGTRRGFWLAGGFGYGKESFRFGSEPFFDNAEKPVFAFRMGGTPNQRLRLGGEIVTFVNPLTDEDGFRITETLTSLNLIGQFYPMPAAGFFLKGGAGIGVSASSVEGGNTLSETGFAVQYGVGYDIRLSRSLALTPTVEMIRHRFTKTGDDTLHERLLHFGVALTWQK